MRLDPCWPACIAAIVVTLTDFGRTAAVNGAGGTNPGAGTPILEEEDCNANGVADSIEVDPLYCLGQDCDASGVPDDCEGGVQCSLRINEVRVTESTSDANEYFELRGAPGTSLDGLTYIVIGDDVEDHNSGVIEEAVDLSGLVVSNSGLFVVVDTLATFGNSDASVDLNLEADDNVTHLLVRNFSGSIHDDLDVNDDGVLDTEPWGGVIHALALVKDPASSPTGTEHIYTPSDLSGGLLTVGPDGLTSPSHVYICTRGENWLAAIGPADVAPVDTPGGENASCPYEWCPEDIDQDGVVEFGDLLQVLAAGTGPCCGCPEDVNADGVIDGLDIDQVTSNYGLCCPGDLDGDGDVDKADLNILLDEFDIDCDGCRGDLTGDGEVDFDDVERLLELWGPCT